MKKALIAMSAVLLVAGCGKKVDEDKTYEATMMEIKNNYITVEGFKDSFARVYKDGKYGYIDSTGNEVVPCIYDSTNYSGFADDMLAVKKDGLWGYVNKEGVEVVPCIYQEAYDFNEGLAMVGQDNFYGYIDKKGIEVVPCVYDYLSSVNEGLVSARVGEQWYILQIK